MGINVYLWNGETGSVEQVQDVGGGACITSLSWSQNGRFLAIGLDNGGIQVIIFNDNYLDNFFSCIMRTVVRK